MAYQASFPVRTTGRGLIEITSQVAELVSEIAPVTGIVHVFVKHTSCSLVITENADPSVRRDLETLAQRWAPDGDPAYWHDMEGEDDMSAHARSVLTDTSVTVPVDRGRLLLGPWQGIYLWEHRTHGHCREVVVTVIG